MGADRFYIQPLRRQHRALVHLWEGGRAAPPDPQAHPRGPHRSRYSSWEGRGLWAGTALGEGPALLMPGAVRNSQAPRAAFTSMQGVPTHGAGRGHMATSCALRLSAWRTRRPPAPEQLFTIYKARSLTWALEPWALGQRSLRVPMLQMGTQRPKDEKWLLQACARTAGTAAVGVGSAARRPACASPGCVCCKHGGVLGFSYHPGVMLFSSVPTVGLWGDQRM